MQQNAGRPGRQGRLHRAGARGGRAAAGRSTDRKQPSPREASAVPPADPPPLVEGVDYTVEAGRWVFTAAFLLRRGYCCGSKCRNCPYPSSPRVAEGTTPPGRTPPSGSAPPAR
ncbi:MAG: DUF5522 domain-containing protein [Gemmataceae bacterium]